MASLCYVKSDSLVVVKTDSLVAISSIEKLCKVKIHNGVVWNELADKLAKKAVQLEEMVTVNTTCLFGRMGNTLTTQRKVLSVSVIATGPSDRQGLRSWKELDIEEWRETENTALSAAWAVLLDVAKLSLSAWDLGEILLSDTKEIHFKERELYLSGLVKKRKFELLYKKGFRGGLQEIEKEVSFEQSLKRKCKNKGVRRKASPDPELTEVRRKNREQIK
ncbi:hypothetical protein C2G38_2206491 [Gigaspora rosea]|uniref:Uncharacterized protein n=1 Tax=Gigaspora rosea TaxID=44941 RepID=A0A397UJ36_9GLOM|nr:hypothetical protein C2G38_2206491 [Gigaspora rosea]